MRWWPFGRRDGGRHSFGAAVTSLPTGPLRLPVPETAAELDVPTSPSADLWAWTDDADLAVDDTWADAYSVGAALDATDGRAAGRRLVRRRRPRRAGCTTTGS